MRARFRDGRTGDWRPLEAAQPPRLAWSCEPFPEGTLAAARARHGAAALEAALRHLGCELVAAKPAEAELHFGARKPGAGAVWLKPGPGPEVPEAEAKARWTELDLKIWSLRRRYSDAAGSDWRGELASAADEAARLRSIAAALATRAPGMPNAAGLAGYRKRLRDALAADFDAPAALSCAWDALRPGALSPASQLAALKEADAALGLGLFAVFPN